MVPEISELEDHDEVQSEMMAEMCLIVDKQDNVIGSETKRECHS